MPREGLTLRCEKCKMENYITKRTKITSAQNGSTKILLKM